MFSANQSIDNPGRMHQPYAGCSGPPPFNPNPNGSGSIFPGPPAMANGSKLPKHMGVSHDAKTPVINPNPNEFTGIPNFSAGGNPSQPYPNQYLSLPPQLPQHDTTGVQYYCRAVEESYANLLLQLQKSRADWLDLYYKTSQELQEKSEEIGKLTVVSPPPISSAISDRYLGCGFSRKERPHEVRETIQHPRCLR